MDTIVWPYRLKTARQKKRLQRKDRDKQLLRLEKAHENLQQQKKELPCMLLDAPYQKGWKRLFVLRPEIASSEKAEFYQQILDVLTEVQYHYDASFKKPKRKGVWHRYYFERLPRLRTIDSLSNSLKLTDEQKACFEAVKYWSDSRYDWAYKYQFAHPELFEVAILPHMVYQLQLPDGELESQLDFIGNQLYERPAIHRYWKIKGGRYKNWYAKSFPEKAKYVDPLKNKPLHEIF